MESNGNILKQKECNSKFSKIWRIKTDWYDLDRIWVEISNTFKEEVNNKENLLM